MVAHAKKYSPGYKKDLEKGTQWTFWAKDFDGMAYKTMLRQLISKWGIMSIDLIQAIDADMAVIHADGTKEYVETDVDNIAAEQPAESPEPDETPQPQSVREPLELPESSGNLAIEFLLI